MPTWLLVLLIFVVTHRLTRLAVKDEVPIVRVPRDALIKFLDPTPEQRAADPTAKGHWNDGKPNTALFVIAGLMLAVVATSVTVLAAEGETKGAAAMAAASVLVAAALGIIGSGKIGSALAYLLECPWCMGAWVGAAVVFVTDLFVPVPAPFLVWIAASTVTGLIADYEVRHDQKYALADIEKRRALAAEQREARR